MQGEPLAVQRSFLASYCSRVLIRRRRQVGKYWPSFCKDATNAMRSVSFVKDTNGSGNGKFLRTRF